MLLAKQEHGNDDDKQAQQPVAIHDGPLHEGSEHRVKRLVGICAHSKAYLKIEAARWAASVLN